MRKFLISVLFLFLFCPFVFADDDIIPVIPVPMVETTFYSDDICVSAKGLIKDLVYNDTRCIVMGNITCSNYSCGIKGAKLCFVPGLGIPILSDEWLGGYDSYIITEKDNNHIKAELDKNKFSGYILINLKNKTANIQYENIPGFTEKYQLITDFDKSYSEIRKFVKRISDD